MQMLMLLHMNPMTSEEVKKACVAFGSRKVHGVSRRWQHNS